MKSQTMSFGITRFLVAIGILGVAFAAPQRLGFAGAMAIWMSIVSGLPLAVLILVSKRGNAVVIIRSLLYCGIGLTLALLLCSPSRLRLQVDGCKYAIAGALAGWLVGLVIERLQTQRRRQ